MLLFISHIAFPRSASPLNYFWILKSPYFQCTKFIWGGKNWLLTDWSTIGVSDCNTLATLNFMLGTLWNLTFRPAVQALKRRKKKGGGGKETSSKTKLENSTTSPVFCCINDHWQKFRACNFWAHNRGKERNCMEDGHPIQIVWVVNHIQNLSGYWWVILAIIQRQISMSHLNLNTFPLPKKSVIL